MTWPIARRSARVRGLGSAKSGADHFWKQRLTAVANIALAAFLIWLVVASACRLRRRRGTLAKRTTPSRCCWCCRASSTCARYANHHRGLVHSEGRKVAALMLNLFFCVLVGLTCAFAVLKLSWSLRHGRKEHSR